MENKIIELKLKLDDVNIILQALAEIAFKLASPIITEIHKQAIPQTADEEQEKNFETNVKK